MQDRLHNGHNSRLEYWKGDRAAMATARVVAEPRSRSTITSHHFNAQNDKTDRQTSRLGPCWCQRHFSTRYSRTFTTESCSAAAAEIGSRVDSSNQIKDGEGLVAPRRAASTALGSDREKTPGFSGSWSHCRPYRNGTA